jgi:hypothetical protein
MSSRGFADLSPPEAEHAMLELPTNRAEYVGVLQDLGDYPARSPIGYRVPSAEEVEVLQRLSGRWRAIVLLDDERALRLTTGLFARLFVLDPFYDTGALLYAAWHDPLIRDEHSRRLAQHAGLLVRAGPLLDSGTAVLAPEHLPGSWNPRPGWRKPKSTDHPRQLAAWSIRTALVLLYWADRLDGVLCTSHPDVIAAVDTILGSQATARAVSLVEPARIEEAQTARLETLATLTDGWSEVRGLSRRRSARRLDDLACGLVDLADRLPIEEPARRRPWRLVLGSTSVPSPAFLIRRVLNGEDPDRPPALARQPLKRRVLALLPATLDVS